MSTHSPEAIERPKKPITTRKYDIIMGTTYECRGGVRAPLGVVTRRWRSPDMSSVRIPLSSRKYPGLYAIVDEADVELVSRYRWFPMHSKNSVYAATGHDSTPMHRMIASLLFDIDGFEVDHVNRNGLDNRRSNLRRATSSQNKHNTIRQRSSATPFIGIWRRPNGRWTARLKVNNKSVGIGTFETETEAARAYDRAAVFYRGPFAVTNESLGHFSLYDDEGDAA